VSRPERGTPTEGRTLPRIYAHYHRVLIELLEELVANSRVIWLAGEEGHIRRPEGEPNTYRKALPARGRLALPGAAQGARGGPARGASVHWSW